MNLTLRPATTGDMRQLWEWRNDPVTRQMFRHTDVVPWETHQQWCASVLSDPERLLLVAESSGTPVGTVRFDEVSSTGGAEVSVTVAPECRGGGLGTEILRQGTEQALGRWSKVVAFIKRDNIASQRAFSHAGYQWAGQTDTEVVLIAGEVSR